MATILKAGNVASGAQITSDATGILEIKTGTGAGTTAITVGTDQAVSIGGNNISAVNSLGFRNRIINGDMRIDQRNNGASGTGTDNYVVDRFRVQTSQSGRWTWGQNLGSVTPPTGYRNYLGVSSSSAYSLLAGDYFVLTQAVEGTNCVDLAFGTAGASAVTLSFWVRSSLTGTFSTSIMNSAQSRSYVSTYTINSANTWEYKTITVPGDTSGTWLTDTNIGLFVRFSLGVGSTYSTSSTGSWVATAAWSATGSTNVMGTNGATFYITGVQLEAGSVATPFERRDYGRELMMCQRYFRFAGGGAGRAISSSATEIIQMLSPQMRATPSATLVSGTDAVLEPGIAFRAITGVSVAGGVNNNNAVLLGTSGSTGMTTGNVVLTPGNNGISLSAEL